MRYARFVLVMMLLGWPGSVAAQERTLFDGPVETGTFGSAAVKVTSLRDEAAVLVGGRGGLVINHSFLLGAGAYGVVSEFDAPDGVRPEEGPLDIAFGYGGLELEYRFFPQSVGHFGVSTLVGGGAIHYVKDANRLGRRRDRIGERDVVFVVEPGVNAEVNITRWFHLNAGVSYRVVSGVGQERLTDSDFSGAAAALHFKFGRF